MICVMIWYDKVWYIWYVLRYDIIYDIYDMCYDMIWYDKIWYIWYVLWYDMIRYDIYDMCYDIRYDMIYDMIYFINCSRVVTRWQYTFTHKQYTEQHK
jgi:hypothetical protein